MKAISTKQKLGLLQEAGISLAEVARLSGVPQPTISRIARGIHEAPREKTVMAVDRVYQAKLTAGSTQEASA